MIGKSREKVGWLRCLRPIRGFFKGSNPFLKATLKEHDTEYRNMIKNTGIR